jgi:Ca-activated chloride channel family protein
MIVVHFISIQSRGKHSIKFANYHAISRIKGVDLYSKNLIVLVLSVFAFFCLIMSMSGLTLDIKTNSTANSFVIAIDTSRSMEANDISPSRLEGAKNIAIEFVKNSRVGTRVGIISFSGIATIERPVTDDTVLITNAIRNIDFSEVGGTDISEAITTSINILKNEDKKSIILFSDGQINTGDLNYALEYAEDNKVVINTIAIGTKTGGQTGYGVSKLDEDTLEAIAYNTDGKLLSIENNEDIEMYFNDIMDLRIRDVSINLSKSLIIGAVILFFIQYVLLNTRYKSLP